MTAKPKKKRDLLSTFQSIERYHRRRSVFILHAVLSIALQMAMWGNWYASYAQYGRGFTLNFFADRIIVSGIFTLVLIGHYILMQMTGAKDRLVVLALERHEDELQSYESNDEDDEDSGNGESDSYVIEKMRRLTK